MWSASIKSKTCQYQLWHLSGLESVNYGIKILFIKQLKMTLGNPKKVSQLILDKNQPHKMGI